MKKIKNFWWRSIRRLAKNQLIKGSAILFSGTIFSNLGNYFYHLVMGRMLGPSDYGALESVISLVYIFGIPVAALSLVVTKKVSTLRGRKQEEKIGAFYHFLIKKLFWLSFLVMVVAVFVSPLIKSFLHLNSVLPVLLMIGLSFLGVFGGVNLAVLNGFLEFFKTSLTGIVQTGIKLASAILLVGLGFSINGASASFLIGAFFSLSLGSFFVGKLLKKSDKDEDGFELGGLFRQSLPFLILSFSFISLYTVDIFLARHFLSSQEAGFYAALSVLGKIITFACSPISQVMFPIASKRHAAGENYKRLFFLALSLVFLICLGVNLVYFLFPTLMIKILFGGEYLEAAKYLGVFGLFLSFYSLSSFLAQFLLSISKNKSVFLPFLAAIFQIIMIVFFHQSLVQIAWVSAGVCGLLFFSLTAYFFLNWQKGR